MTVTNTTNRWEYTGDGVTANFAYTSKIFAETDLTVKRRTISTGALTSFALTTDYTVSGVGVAGGGNVTPVVTLSALYQLVIERNTPATQATDLQDDGPFPADTTETALDKLTVLSQQLEYKAARTLRQPIGDNTAISELPNATDRASKLLGFDSSGNPTASAVSLPSTLVALDYVRVNTAGTAYELRTPAEVRTDLSLGSAALSSAGDFDAAGSAAAAQAASQPVDADLTAIAALSSAADQLPYATGAQAWALTTLTAFIRTLLDDANQAAALTTLGIANHNNVVVSAAGEMTIPTQPAFEAYNSATDGSATGDGTTATVIFDTEVSDQGGDYDNATGTFTAPVSGFYHLMAQVRHGTVASGHTSGFMNIATSNETIRNYWDPYANSRKSDASSTLTMSAITYMDAADTATVSTNVSGGAKDVGIIGNRGQTTFSGVLLC